jgi:UDP-N-acetylmuramate dehydrogenase
MTIESDVPLSLWCTLGVGGPARWFCHAPDETSVMAALAWADARGVAVHVLGGGSNVVFADEGFDGLVVHVAIQGVATAARNDAVVFSAGAGEPWDAFVAATVAAECGGLECLSGIPGCVGGTPVQNVGAYGQDVSGTITTVHAVDRRTWRRTTFSNEECHFGYRTSRFKREDLNRFIVTRVEFALAPRTAPTLTYADVVAYFEQAGDTSPSLAAVRDAILAIRRRKGMVIEDGNPANHSVGSFFVNPVITRDHYDRLEAGFGGGTSVPHYPIGTTSVKIPAAWLIERAGFAKGVTRGPVGVSPFQAQAIVNHGGAQAADILRLAVDIKRAVWEEFAVAIVPEPVFVGFPPTAELQWLLDPQPSTVRAGE